MDEVKGDDSLEEVFLELEAESMNDMAAPSISLEGRNLWLPQSLPIAPKIILYAKASVQLILSGIPMLIAVTCAVTVVDAVPAVRLLIILTTMMYVIFSAFFNVFLGNKMPLLNWTSEIAPIKQSGGVFIAMFGGWPVFISSLVGKQK